MTPGFVGVNSDFDKAAPSLEVEIDRDRAAALGVAVLDIEAAMGYSFGGQMITQIYASNDQYQVILELLPELQRNAAALKTLYLTSSSGTLVPLSSVTKSRTSTIPLTVNHSGSVPAVTISFDLLEGYALSDAVRGIDRASAKVGIPPTIQGSYQGTAGAFQAATQNMGLLLGIAILVVYIILGILYESFIHPLTILSGLPSAAVRRAAHALFRGLAAHALRVRRYGDVDRHREEERDHDGRLRDQPAARRGGAPRARDLRGRDRTVPADHDDDACGNDGHVADRARHRHGRRVAPAARTLRRGRPAALAATHALHHADDLRLSRPFRRALHARLRERPDARRRPRCPNSGYLGCGTMRRYGFGDFQPPGYFCFASSSDTDGTMITSSPCFQFAGVATLCLAVS